MSSKLLALGLAMLLTYATSAQHCPYDGGSLVAIKLVDAKGKMLNAAAYSAYLVEVDNPFADSCTYAEGLLKIKLLDKKAFYASCDDHYRKFYSDALKKRLQQKGVFSTANLFVIFNQAQTECMLKNNNDFDYRTRKFVVQVVHKGKTVTVPVPENGVRSLCTNNVSGFDGFEGVLVSLGF
jgi:hypothetical protein